VPVNIIELLRAQEPSRSRNWTSRRKTAKSRCSGLSPATSGHRLANTSA